MSLVLTMFSSLALTLLLDITAAPTCRCCEYDVDDDFVRLPFEKEEELQSAIALTLSGQISLEAVR